jgi:hypothetical protein
MPRFRLFQAGSGDAPDSRQSNDRPWVDGAPGADDPLLHELRAAYAPPSERYWDDLEGRILQAVRAGTAGAASPARAAAEWWQAMAGWARPGLAAAAVLMVVAGAVAIQARAAGAHLAGAGAGSPGSELRPLDPELARALDDAGLDSVSAAAARGAREAAYLLTGGLKLRAPVQIDMPTEPARTNPRARLTDEADDVQRARREATFRYVMPD